MYGIIFKCNTFLQKLLSNAPVVKIKSNSIYQISCDQAPGTVPDTAAGPVHPSSPLQTSAQGQAQKRKVEQNNNIMQPLKKKQV